MTDTEAIVNPTRISHVRLTVTDIQRSKAFYQRLLGPELAFDFDDHVDEPGVREDPAQLYGGCGFTLGRQLLGLRPVADPADSFRSTRVGLEHGELTDLGDLAMSIVSVQDPDDINLELSAASGS